MKVILVPFLCTYNPLKVQVVGFKKDLFYQKNNYSQNE